MKLTREEAYGVATQLRHMNQRDLGDNLSLAAMKVYENEMVEIKLPDKDIPVAIEALRRYRDQQEEEVKFKKESEALKREFEKATTTERKIRKEKASPLKKRRTELLAELKEVREALERIEIEFNAATRDRYIPYRDKQDQLMRDHIQTLYK